MLRLAALGALILLILCAAGHAAGWPTKHPANYFKLAAKGNPTLVCAEWSFRGGTVVDCKLLTATSYLSWPPATVRPVKIWAARGRVCEQWNGARHDTYAGLVVRCLPAASAKAALWWSAPEGTAVKRHRV